MTKKAIFRAEAVLRYVRSKEQTVLPRFLRPRTFLILWILLGALGIGLVTAWATHVPVYASGTVVAIEPDEGVRIAVLLPADDHPRLAVGQRIFVRWSESDQPQLATVLAVDPEVQSPRTVQQRYGSHGEFNKPAAVVLARLGPDPKGLPPASLVGSVGRADVEVGGRRVIGMLPVLKEWF